MRWRGWSDFESDELARRYLQHPWELTRAEEKELQRRTDRRLAAQRAQHERVRRMPRPDGFVYAKRRVVNHGRIEVACPEHMRHEDTWWRADSVKAAHPHISNATATPAADEYWYLTLLLFGSDPTWPRETLSELRALQAARVREHRDAVAAEWGSRTFIDGNAPPGFFRFEDRRIAGSRLQVAVAVHTDEGAETEPPIYNGLMAVREFPYIPGTPLNAAAVEYQKHAEALVPGDPAEAAIRTRSCRGIGIVWPRKTLSELRRQRYA